MGFKSCSFVGGWIFAVTAELPVMWLRVKQCSRIRAGDVMFCHTAVYQQKQ